MLAGKETRLIGRRKWVVWAAMLAVAGTTLLSADGCSAYLAFRESVLSGSSPLIWTPWASSGLSPGVYNGQAQCTMLVAEEGGEPILEDFETAVNLTVDGAGALSRDATPLVEGATVDLRLGSFSIDELLTAVTAARSMVTVNFEASLTLDAQTPFPVKLNGQGAETYTPQADGSIAYALAVEMKQQNEDGSSGPMTVAYQCQADLSR
jgi:hypothetical protein